MKQRAAAGLLVLALSCATTVASALELSMAPPPPVLVAHPQTFSVAQVSGSQGEVTFRWNFGDGTVSEPATARTATHTYAAPGHYTVIVQAADEAGRTSDVVVQTVTNLLTATAPSNSTSILYDPAHERVWAVNPDSDSVTAIDARSLQKALEIPVGIEPHSLAPAPDGTIWVSCQRSDEIVVLDPDSGAIVDRIALPYASQPHAVAIASTGKAYVTLYATGKLVEIDAAARVPLRELFLGPTPAGVSVAADGRVFVTRFLSPVDHGEVWVVSPSSFSLANTIQLPFDLGPDTQSSGRGVPNYVSSIAISPDGTQAWVSAKKDDVARGRQRDGLPMTADNFVRSALCTIDLSTELEVVSKRQDIDNRSMPVAVAFSALGDYAFVAVLTSNWVGVTDAYSAQSVTGLKDVGSAPDGLVLLPDGRLFVNAFLSREVIAYDVTASLASLDHGAPEPLVRVRTVEHEPLSPELLLGKQVYYDAADTRMGHAGYWACGSCHFGGFSDGRVWDFSDRGEGLRNTKSLLGVRGTQGQGRVHWSGNMDEIQDFERDIRESFQGTGFMADDVYLGHHGSSGDFDPFGAPSAGASVELDALSAYITSFDQVGRSPFRNPDGSFSKAARAGRKVFERAGCPGCHSGPDFTDSPSNVLHDVGTLLPTSGMRLGEPLTGIDTPTLKGLWQTAPYLHDGRAATLEEVFAITKDRMGIVSNLSPEELQQLVRYLLELDDVPEKVVEDGEPAERDAAGWFPACALRAPTPTRASPPSALLAVLALAWRLRRERAANAKRRAAGESGGNDSSTRKDHS